MHDGHNLFDLTNSNFNKIWAPGPDRYRQYLPRSAYNLASGPVRAQMDAMADGAEVVSDRYLAWMTGPLKTWVDSSFCTRSGRDDTAIVGSSMGGLMTCYAFLEAREVFGRAGCIASHWSAIDPRAVIPTCNDHDPRVHWRRPMVMMRHG